MHVLDFLTELQNAEVSVTLPKSDSTIDAFPAILKILGTNKGNTCGGVSFWHSYRWVDWTARIFLKGTLLKTFFFDNFPKLS